MTIQIGEKIKLLRSKAGATQDKLAEYLGVTAQAVSRWENGSGYPDIELLPSIAAYFNVTTDELLGVENRSEQEQSKLILDVKALMVQGKTEEALRLGREGLALYPSNYTLIFIVATLIMTKGKPHDHQLPDEEKAACLREAASMFRRILRDCSYNGVAGDMIRTGAKNMLTLTLGLLGENDEALKIAYELPQMAMAQEFVVQRYIFGEDRIKFSLPAAANIIPMIMAFMRMMKYPDLSMNEMSEESELSELTAKLAIWDAIYDSAGEHGIAFKQKIWMYITLNITLTIKYIELGELDKAYDYFKRIAEYCTSEGESGVEFDRYQRTEILRSSKVCLKTDEDWSEKSNKYVFLHGYVENGCFDALKNFDGYDDVVRSLS